jgi:hypothetical protein
MRKQVMTTLLLLFFAFFLTSCDLLGSTTRVTTTKPTDKATTSVATTRGQTTSISTVTSTTFTRKVTIQFYFGSKLIESKDFEYGSEIIPPENATLEPTDVVFVFKGWEDFTEGDIATENKIYLAKYETYSVGLDFILSEEGDYYSVKAAYPTKSSYLFIPSEYNGLPVKEIAEGAFINNDNITNVVLPDSIEKIGAYAFALCDKLEEINLPEKITYLPEGLFSK